MKLEQFFRAECRCGLHRFVQAPDKATAIVALESLGWTDVCARCTVMRAATPSDGISPPVNRR